MDNFEDEENNEDDGIIENGDEGKESENDEKEFIELE